METTKAPTFPYPGTFREFCLHTATWLQKEPHDFTEFENSSVRNFLFYENPERPGAGIYCPKNPDSLQKWYVELHVNLLHKSFGWFYLFAHFPNADPDINPVLRENVQLPVKTIKKAINPVQLSHALQIAQQLQAQLTELQQD